MQMWVSMFNSQWGRIFFRICACEENSVLDIRHNSIDSYPRGSSHVYYPNLLPDSKGIHATLTHNPEVASSNPGSGGHFKFYTSINIHYRTGPMIYLQLQRFSDNR